MELLDVTFTRTVVLGTWMIIVLYSVDFIQVGCHVLANNVELPKLKPHGKENVLNVLHKGERLEELPRFTDLNGVKDTDNYVPKSNNIVKSTQSLRTVWGNFFINLHGNSHTEITGDDDNVMRYFIARKTYSGHEIDKQLTESGKEINIISALLPDAWSGTRFEQRSPQHEVKKRLKRGLPRKDFASKEEIILAVTGVAVVCLLIGIFLCVCFCPRCKKKAEVGDNSRPKDMGVFYVSRGTYNLAFSPDMEDGTVTYENLEDS